LTFYISSNDPNLAFPSPSSGTLFGSQSTQVQVFVNNPNVVGTRTTRLTVSAPGAQNSPQFVSITVNTSSVFDPNEPNDSPQQATFLSTPPQGQSVSITGNATPDDAGTVVNQLVQECGFDGIVQDWFRLVVNQRGAFQVSLNFSGSDMDYDLWWFRETNDFANFPQGVQLFALSAQQAGQQEMIATRLLEQGTYYLGVTRFRRSDASDAQRVNYTLTLRRGLSPETHAVEDAACLGFLGPETGAGGLFVVNRVRPTQYPARLESISALFFDHPGQPSPNKRSVRIVAFTDLSGSGTPPFNPSLVVDQTITITVPSFSQGQFNTLTLGASGPITSSGDFYIGYVVNTSSGIFPDAGRVLFPGIRSFVSRDGGFSYQTFDLRDPNTGRPLNVAIRASVNTTPFGSSSLMLHSSDDDVRQDKIPIDRPRVKLDELFE
jgi:hypothetical protein